MRSPAAAAAYALAAILAAVGCKEGESNANVKRDQTVPDAGSDTEREARKLCNWHIEAMRFPKVWERIQRKTGKPAGAGIEIAVIDTGVMKDHPELKGANIAWEKGFDFVRNAAGDVSPDTRPMFNAWIHGTLTTSTIISPPGKHPETSGDVGITGVAPGATLVPVRGINRIFSVNDVFRPLMPDAGAEASLLARAIRWSAEQGVEVVSISLGTLFSPAIDAAVKYAEAKGTVVVATTGHSLDVMNVPISPRLRPGILPSAVGVTGSQRGETPWVRSIPGTGIDIAAPAFPMCWTNVERNEDKTPKLPVVGKVQVGDGGTSFSTAITAGSIAMWMSFVGEDILARYPGALRTALVKRVLKESAKKPEGWDAAKFGPGILDPMALLDIPLPSPDELQSAK